MTKHDFFVRNRNGVLAGVGVLILLAGIAAAQGLRLRQHTATETAPINYVLAERSPPGQNEVSITKQADGIAITGNSIPPHLVGRFPNRGNPHEITAQPLSLHVPAQPQLLGRITPLQAGWRFGVSVHGVFFDPLAAEFWKGERDSGWNYNALGGAVKLGIDTNFAHVQPTGAYHYHGIPFGLMQLLEYSEEAHSPLLGYAADGFPIYALTGQVDGVATKMTPSYRLRAGNRPGGDAPDGAYDGTFHADYEYVPGAGNLDECNGAVTVSAEYPQGSYAYFLTSDYPVIPMCWKGTPDESFARGRR